MLADHYVVLDSVQYEKDYFQNRNKVIDRNGSVDYISVPVLISDGRWKNSIREIHINLSHPWQKKYLGKIKGCYAGFPYFKTLYPELEKIINETPVTIFELNMSLIHFFRALLDISTPISFASEFESSLCASELSLDLCKHNEATIYLSGPSGRDYLDEDIFLKENISVHYHQFTPPKYEMELFAPGLSTLDLVMRLGPQAAEVIHSGGRAI